MGKILAVDIVGNDQLSAPVRQAKESVEQLSKSAGRVRRSLEDVPVAFESIKNSSGTLTKKINSVKKELRALADAGEAESAIFKEMAAQAREWKKQLKVVDDALDITKEQVEGTSDSIENIGERFEKLTSDATPLEKKLSDLRSMMVELAVAGEQNSELYQQMAATARGYQKALDDVRRDTHNLEKQTEDTSDSLENIGERFDKLVTGALPLEKKVSGLRSMMLELAAAGKQNSELYRQMAATARTYQTAIDNVRKDTRGLTEETLDLKGALREVASKVGLGGVAQQLVGISSLTGAATLGAGALATVLYKGAAAAADFDKHLDALQALTGLTSDGMTEIADGALEMSKKFGMSASGVADAMGLIGSQAPELLKSSEALMSVTDAANVLSKAAGIEVVQAAKGITTVMNQMGVSAQRASDIINTLAAGSQKGSADVAYLQTAFEKSGTIASQSGLSFEELAGAIEAIAPKFSSAEVAGTSLAAFFKQLEKQTNNKYKPAVVGITTALDNLAAANMSTAAQMRMFGDAGYSAAVTLITQREQFAELTKEMTGTNTAYEQMATVTDNFEGKMNRLKASWEAFLITIGDSKWISHIVESVQDVMAMLGEIMGQIEGVVDAFDSFDVGVEGVSLLTAELGLLKGILGVVLGIIEGIVRYLAKGYNYVATVAAKICGEIEAQWKKLTDAVADVKAFKIAAAAFEVIKSVFRSVVDDVKKMWSDLLRWLGMETPDEDIYDISGISHNGTTNAAKAFKEYKDKEEANKKTKGAGDGTKKKKTTAEAGSIADLQKKIKALDDELQNSGKLSRARVAQIKQERAALEQQIQAIRNLSREDAGKMKSVDSAKPTALTKVKNTALDQLQTKTGAGLEGNAIMDGMQARLDEQFEAFRAHRERIRGIIDGMRGDADAGALAFIDLAEVLRDSMTSSTDKAVAGLVTIGSSLQQLGADGPVAKAGALMAAIGQAILGFATASAQAESLGPFGWLAFVGAGLGTLASMVSTLKGFNAGGIVEGNSFHGDRMLARVNAGEMVLTRPQQGRLFDILDGGGGPMAGGGTVRFEITGDKLTGVLNNYNRKMGKVR